MSSRRSSRNFPSIILLAFFAAMYLEPNRTSTIEFFCGNVRLGSKYASALDENVTNCLELLHSKAVALIKLYFEKRP